jgi:hypothetical protein
MNEIRVPLRDYLDDKDRDLRRWMAATFATKDDLANVRSDVRVLTERDVRESRKVAAAWGGAGTMIGGALVAVLAYFGIKPQQ